MSSWFWIPYARPTAPLRLYCFASAGAGAGAFARWAQIAPPGMEIAAIQLPGREIRIAEEPLRSLAAASAAIAPAITEADTRPFALFGHSAGARLSLHVAARLEYAGRPPVHVFVSGTRSSISRDTPLHDLDSAEFLRRVSQRYGALPVELTRDPAIWSIFERPLRADLEAIETDTLQPVPLSTAVTVISGSRDEIAREDPSDLWQAWSRFPIDRVSVDGDHFSYRTEPTPYLNVVTARLRDAAHLIGACSSSAERPD